MLFRTRATTGVATVLIMFISSGALAQSVPAVGPNVNMVSGLSLADGDPFLTKQNEPSMAVSSANPLHLMAGGNDYRLVDLAQSLDNPGGGGDSWVGVYKSTDGGRTWRSSVLSGCPLNIAACNSPLSSAIKGLQFASDPTVRSGPYGTFFYSFIAGNRGTGAAGVVGVQRFIDLNNNVRLSDDPFVADKLNVIDSGTSGQFLDKPWNAADTPGRTWNANATCVLPDYSAPVPAFNVYVAYSNFVGQDTSNPHPQIFVAVSNDCGNTFQKPKKVSQSVSTNSGSIVTIDPKDGSVYVFWRQFYTAANLSPDAIYVVKSSDGGNSWSNPSLVAQINPFDQGTSGTSFRTSAYPTAVVSVDANGNSRVHVAWSQRGVGPVPPGSTLGVGAARIVMSTSTDGGAHWSTPAAVDNSFQSQPVPYAYTIPPSGMPIGWSAFNSYNPLGYGHQIQPALTFAAGKLTLVWLDQRMDETVGVLQCPPENPNQPFNTGQCYETRIPNLDSAGNPVPVASVFNDQISDAGVARRHTLDVFGGQALPQDQPVFTTRRVSQYLFGSKSVPIGSSGTRTRQTIRQIRFNVPNLPIYVNGTATFLGDYIDVAAQQMLPTPDPQHPYKWNTSPSNKTIFHGTWTDNRDINAPKDGNWQNYTPIKLLAIDPVTGNATINTNTACLPGQEGMKNQNLYTATIFEGVDAYAVVNSKYLNSTTPRSFNIVVQNSTPQTGYFQLVVPSLPTGTSATFKLPFSAPGGTPPPPVLLSIPPYSSTTRTLWVMSSSPGTTVTVNVNNVSSDGSLVPVTSVLLNPDSSATMQTTSGSTLEVSNNNQSDVAVTNTALANNDLTNVNVPANDLTNNDLTNNDLTNNDLTNNDLTNSAILNNDLTNNDLTNNDLTNNDLTNNDLTNNDLTNNDLTNAGLADSTFTLFNNGTTDVALNLKTLMRGSVLPPNYKVQLIVRKLYATQVPNPRASGTCGYAKVQQSVPVLNIPHPGVTSPTDPTISQFLTDTSDTPTVALLPQETARVTYRLVYTPPPPQPGQPPATLSDTQPVALEFGANGVKVVAVNASTNVVPIPLVIETLTLPSATTGQPYSTPLLVNGGSGVKTWSLAPGSVLPSGFSLSASGVLSDDPTIATAPNSYTFTVQVSDQTTPNSETDKQMLTLFVQGVQHLLFPTAALAYGGSASLSANTDVGLPVTYQASGSCTLTGTTLTATAGTGTCIVNATQAGNQTYLALSASQTFTLAPAPLTVTANSLSVVYGGAPLFTSTISGLVGTDTAASLGIVAHATSAALANGLVTSPVGSYSITPYGLASVNYAIVYKPGVLTVSPAPLTITANNQTMSYGGTIPPLTGTLIGVRNSDPITATYSTTATSASTVGTYAITPTVLDPGGKLGNYTVTLKNGVLSVTPTGLVVIPANATRQYGTPNLTLTGTISGIQNGDNITAAFSTTATAVSPTGTYPITAALSDPTNKLGNYALTLNPGALTVTKAPLTVAAVSGSKVFGDPLPAFSIISSGYLLSDTPQTVLTGTLVFASAATATSGVGSYSVTPGGLSALNYAITFVPGTLTITPAQPVFSNLTSATIPAGTASTTISGSISYASTAPSGSVMITLNGVQQSAAIGPSGAFSASFATGTLALGTYPISFSYSGDTNFKSATGSGSLGIAGFQATGTMIVERSFHTATLLPSGKVLVAGGFNKSGASLATSEVYDPASRTFTSSANNMPNKAAGHTATLLSNGNVLVVGGGNSSSQLYDPATNTWGPSGGSGARSYHTATVLNNGKVLIAGGSDNSGKALSSAVLYDPVAGSFTSTGNMTAAREFHTASLLPDGTVLIAGGRAASGPSYVYLNTAEIYNPVTGTFSAITNMTTARYGHIAVVYNGNILIAGGSNGGATALATAELFNPTTKTFTGTGSMAASQGRQNFTATVMTPGVLAAGGLGGATALSSAETYQAGAFSPAGNMTAARSAHTATLLQDGTVLITGGQGSTGNSIATAELYKTQ